MKNGLTLVLVLTTLATASVGAKDLGTWGHLWAPAEPDLLVFIQQRLESMEQSGEMKKLQDEAVERVKKNAVRPAPVQGLTPAVRYRATVYDPTFTVAETITDMKGNVVARKGDRVNPLDKVPYNQTLFFIDGDNEDQVKWTKKQISGITDFKIILVNGNIRETSEALDEQIFFDQSGVLTAKFKFEHTPTRITRDGRVLKIEEIPLTGAIK
ncbi:TPA: type-F conjugative transfer system protein TraW [Enterobacter hormaechei subsp. xiangfangensis]|uniref:type-F conjugative transfer system protein TraW n=1 Tax=Enterobacter cloacae complex TaxID=354276 RepID=UPI0013308FCF|nr:type-F conjugative transfer system protein TraW [Enterobacter roggenkampii]MCM7653696.1 type-F conjugative transfer system protein TraW [Enterobacter hormaechei]HCM9429395.1 type-F conjugative transfer system protein TraW [Enterobacter hormaechei subsp. xiangfangensis]